MFLAENPRHRPQIAGEHITSRTANTDSGSNVRGKGMHSWDSLAALGFYLGMADAGKLADRAASHPGADRMLASITGTASLLAGQFTPGVAGDVPEALAVDGLRRPGCT